MPAPRPSAARAAAVHGSPSVCIARAHPSQRSPAGCPVKSRNRGTTQTIAMSNSTRPRGPPAREQPLEQAARSGGQQQIEYDEHRAQTDSGAAHPPVSGCGTARATARQHQQHLDAGGEPEQHLHQKQLAGAAPDRPAACADPATTPCSPRASASAASTRTRRASPSADTAAAGRRPSSASTMSRCHAAIAAQMPYQRRLTIELSRGSAAEAACSATAPAGSRRS